LQFVYPGNGDFIGFVGDFGSGGLVRKAIGYFREAADFPSEGLVGPAWINGVDFSDHWSFWQVGCPAIMVTDTAFFRNKHYHEATDTPERFDYGRPGPGGHRVGERVGQPTSIRPTTLRQNKLPRASAHQCMPRNTIRPL